MREMRRVPGKPSNAPHGGSDRARRPPTTPDSGGENPAGDPRGSAAAGRLAGVRCAVEPVERRVADGRVADDDLLAAVAARELPFERVLDVRDVVAGSAVVGVGE